jgi:hypothetical protein
MRTHARTHVQAAAELERRSGAERAAQSAALQAELAAARNEGDALRAKLVEAERALEAQTRAAAQRSAVSTHALHGAPLPG